MQFRLFYYKRYYFIICVNESGDEHTTFSMSGQGAGPESRGQGPGASGVGRQDGEKRYFLTQFVKTNGRRDLLHIVLCLLHTVRAVLLCVNPTPLPVSPTPSLQAGSSAL